MFCKLEHILSAMAWWCPIFGEVDYLPQLVFPFSILFVGDDLSCFETGVCFVMNWA
jgi:hypothetical protein